ncbi:MAG: RimK family alpha-L-glutamate ligase [Candidatus Binatia bacterium]
MIACLYGRDFAPFVEPVVRDLRAAAAAAGGEIQPLTIEAALHDPARCADVHRLYVLPFDPPAPPAGWIRQLFPRAEVATSFAVQDLCWDKVATQERLLDRGVPVPETLVSTEPDHVHEFVRQHGFAILKERYSCAGQGHIVVWFEDEQLVGDCGSHQYTIELVSGGERRLRDDHLTYPAPFYVQRLVADIGRDVTPGQVLRAYIVDNQIVFWSERYRDQYTRPSDWIVNVSSGAKYRFLFDLSTEITKIALRSAEVIGMRIGVVDIIRTISGGPYVLEVDTDGYHMIIDRQFKHIPEYREFFNLDRYIAEALLVEPQVWRPSARNDAD